MQDTRKTIVETLNGTSSQEPMSLKDICDKSGITLAQANPVLDVLYEGKVVNKATVIRAGITQIYYWQTAKALTPSAWSSFTFSPKAPSTLPPPARRNEVKPSPPINKENEMSRSDVIRNAIRNNPGIAHDELIAKISPSNHPADLKKSADLLEYVMRQGGFERTKDIRTGTNDIIRKYYTTQAWQQRIESAKQVVENTIPTLQQHHDAAPAKQINEPCEPIIKQLDDHIGNANKMVPALQTQEGGNHYKDMKIQPVEFILANNLGFIEGNVVKYVSRWKNKNGVQDLKKARHFLDILIEQESTI